MTKRSNSTRALPPREAIIEAIETFDAQGALSREFLLQRGFCCKNGCKNCPYGFHRRAEEKN